MKKLILTILRRVLIASWLIPVCFIFVFPIGYLLTTGNVRSTLNIILEFVNYIWYGTEL